MFSELVPLWNKPCYVPTPRLISDVIVTQVFCATACNLSKVQCVHFLVFICFTCRAHYLHKTSLLNFPQQLVVNAVKQNKIVLTEKLKGNIPGALAAPALQFPFKHSEMKLSINKGSQTCFILIIINLLVFIIFFFCINVSSKSK